MPKHLCRDAVICPGCGWTGCLDGLANGACPDCGYENGRPPWRLLTIREMLTDSGEYDDVRMDRFLQAILAVMETRETQKNSESEVT